MSFTTMSVISFGKNVAKKRKTLLECVNLLYFGGKTKTQCFAHNLYKRDNKRRIANLPHGVRDLSNVRSSSEHVTANFVMWYTPETFLHNRISNGTVYGRQNSK